MNTNHERSNGGGTSEFNTLLEKSMAELRAKTMGHQTGWRFGTADQWSLDLSQGDLIFTFNDGIVATCPAQIVGSLESTDGSWLWAWANPSIPESLQRDSLRVRDYGQQRQIARLTSEEWACTEEEAWRMAALACKLCDAQGVYRAPAGTAYVFISFGSCAEPRQAFTCSSRPVIAGREVLGDGMSALFVLSAIVLIFAFCREWIMVKQTGWDRLAKRYACRSPFAGKYRACWWVQFIVVRSKFRTVSNVGRMTRWPIRLEFPPYWVSADSCGLCLKRNAWNFLHSPLLIPWDNIQSANEGSYRDLVSIGNAASALETATQGISGRLLQLKLADLSIVAQLAPFEEARPFLAGKLTLLNWQGM